jgi:hypothetical protein
MSDYKPVELESAEDFAARLANDQRPADETPIAECEAPIADCNMEPKPQSQPQPPRRFSGQVTATPKELWSDANKSPRAYATYSTEVKFARPFTVSQGLEYEPMPLNESTAKPRRECWPLEFDLTGVPRDTATRKTLLEQKKLLEASEFTENEETMSPAAQSVRTITENHFTVDQPSTDVFITDINNPPRKNYNPHDPKNEFPKMLYHHETGRVLEIKAGPDAAKQQKAAEKRGFKLKPSPDFNYAKISRAGIAAAAVKGEKREEEMSAEELAALDEQDQAG